MLIIILHASSLKWLQFPLTRAFCSSFASICPLLSWSTAQQQQVDPQIAQWFRAVDQDRSGQIDAKELQKALVNGNWSHFSEEACRMMINMFDKDKSGTINIHEFGALFSYINQWKGMFEAIDKDRSGFIEEGEFSQALTQMGYRFSPTFVQNLLLKYDQRTRKMTLDNFIVASVQIKRLTDSFRSRDREMRGTATLAYEDFMGLAMGAHS
jgi:Ca2+-binding EF-hand superfamily protein